MSRRLEFRALPIEGAFEIRRAPVTDARGYFARVYDEEQFERHGLHRAWVQENESLSSRRGTIRGLHFQRPPHSETKLVRVARGRVMDVVVDLREGSKSYGAWETVELGADEHNLLFVPKGFAHGFCTLTDDALVLYKVDAVYAPQAEGGVRWDDPALGIPWPVEDPIISDKDRALPRLEQLTPLRT